MTKQNKHVVVSQFKDLQDKNKVYEVEELYPKPANKKISAERLEELKTKKSKKTGKPFIKEVEEDDQE